MKAAIVKAALAALAALPMAATLPALAQTSIGLQNYVLTGNHALDTLGGRGLEASAVAYAQDRGTLFFVGDEGLGVVEISRTGQTLSSMAFSGWPTASTNHDAEGLAYLGNGVLVVAEERLQDAYRFNYVAGGSVDLANAASVSFGGDAGNLGTEGIAWDGGDRWVTVKQSSPQAVLGGTLSFAALGGVSTLAPLFDATLLGLASLSDVATLRGVSALGSAAARDNLLILSLDSRRLVEANRQGQVLSSIDLSFLGTQAIEGLTVDDNGVVYLVAENAGALPSRLYVLTPVPEPATALLLVAGACLMAPVLRRRRHRLDATAVS